jgi:hypothetical protein
MSKSDKIGNMNKHMEHKIAIVPSPTPFLGTLKNLGGIPLTRKKPYCPISF